MKNIYDAGNEPLKGTLYFRFGEFWRAGNTLHLTVPERDKCE
jgi:hypothetical protein